MNSDRFDGILTNPTVLKNDSVFHIPRQKYLCMSDSVKCPFCKKDLSAYTKEYIRKHVARCERRLNPYQYSDRKRGRPRLKSVSYCI